MIPIRDENPTRRLPLVTVTFIALNVVAFLVWQPTFGSDEDQQTFFFCNALIPWEISNQTTIGEGGQDAAEEIAEQFQGSEREARALQTALAQRCDDKVWWHSLFVAMFLHAGWLHIAGNMLFLWIFGNNVEDRMSPLPFFLFYLLAGLAATAAQILVGGGDSVIPNLGASGAVAGVLGAYIVMFPRHRVLTLVVFYFITAIYLPAWLVLAMWFVLQLFSGVTALTETVQVGGGVAYWAHIGGFVFGVVVAALFLPKEGLARRPAPPRPDWFGGRGGGRGWPA